MTPLSTNPPTTPVARLWGLIQRPPSSTTTARCGISRTSLSSAPRPSRKTLAATQRALWGRWRIEQPTASSTSALRHRTPVRKAPSAEDGQVKRSSDDSPNGGDGRHEHSAAAYLGRERAAQVI